MHVWILIAFDLHRQLLEFGLYRQLMDAGWFSSVKSIWIEYNLAWVVLGLLVLAVLLFIRGMIRAAWRRPLSHRADRSLDMQQAKALAAQGETLLAAEAYERAGKFGKALEIYELEHRWSAAARAAEQLGDLDKACDYFDRAKDSNGVVRVLCALGRHLDAARRCREDERLVDGATLLLESGLKEEAAVYFGEAGLFAKSATLFRELGDKTRFVEALLNLIHQTHAGFTDDESAQLQEGAAALCKMGRLSESAMMLEASGELEGAACRFEEAGELDQARRCYADAGLFRRALKVCDDPQARLELLHQAREAGEKVNDKEIADAMQAAGQLSQAAVKMQEMGDLDGAVRASLAAGDLGEAANLLAGQGLHGQAADVFVEAGDLRSAQEQFLAAGDRVAAAKVAEQAGDWVRAGEMHFEMEDFARAVDLLQRVEPDHVDAGRVASLLARAFSSLGDAGMAQRMHDRATADLEMTRENLALFYHHARFLEGTGEGLDVSRAQAIYGEILEIQYSYEDVKARHDALGERS